MLIKLVVLSRWKSLQIWQCYARSLLCNQVGHSYAIIFNWKGTNGVIEMIVS